MSVHGYIAMILGIVFSLMIGCGLMGLMFYSSRHGYDDIDRHDRWSGKLLGWTYFFSDLLPLPVALPDPLEPTFVLGLAASTAAIRISAEMIDEFGNA
jgi:hypothetical protein